MNNNFNNIDKKKLIDSVIASSGGKISGDAIESAKNGDMSLLMSALDDKDKEKLNNALKGDNLKKILSSEDAKFLLNKFFGGEK